jgi:predicted AAA+ superfamily ATPase
MRDLPDALAGRIETTELWPFSQGEIDRMPDGFVDAAFQLGPDLHLKSTVSRAEYADRVVRGGLPEAVARTTPRRRERFLDQYVRNLIDREVRELAEIERVPQLRTLVRLLAARSGQVVAAGSLENELGISRPTVARYLHLLKEVFLVRRAPGWSRDLGTRATSASKLVFVDSRRRGKPARHGRARATPPRRRSDHCSKASSALRYPGSSPGRSSGRSCITTGTVTRSKLISSWRTGAAKWWPSR